MLNAADITARLSRSLLVARHQRDMSQPQVSELLRERGVRAGPNEIRRWEHGIVRISERHLLVIVGILGHDLSWWYAEHDEELAALGLDHAVAV